MDDLYGLLGVSPHATVREIGRAYRKVAIVRHRRGAIALGEELTRMRTAFEVLADPVRRSRYDQARKAADAADINGLLLSHARATAEHAARLGRAAVEQTAPIVRRLELEQELRERRAVSGARRRELTRWALTGAALLCVAALLASYAVR